MKAFKRIAALIMVIAMVLAMMPDMGYQTFAADDVTVSEVTESTDPSTEVTVEPTEETTGGSDTITRAEWLQKLVTLFEMTVENDNYPDNYFSDLSEESEYYYDFLLAVQFGLVSCEAGGPVYPDEPVTREFAAQTLNHCLCIQLEDSSTYTFSDSADCSDAYAAQVAVNLGWFSLVDGNFMPELNITAEEYDLMIATAEEAMALEVVDETHENKYELAEGVIEVPNGTTVRRLDTETVEIDLCPVEIKVGDTFVVYIDGLANAYVALEVTLNETVTTIKVTAAENGTAFESIDAEGVVSADITQLQAVDGAEIVFIDEESGQTWTNARDALRKVKTIKTIKVEKEFEVGSGVKSKVTIEIKNPEIEYNFDSSDVKGVYCKLNGETTISAGIEGNLLDAIGVTDMTLFYWGVPGIGGFKVALDLKAEATLTCVTSGDLSVGLGYTKACGIRIIKSFNVESFTFEGEATLQCGIKASLGINDVPKDVIYANVYASVGGKANIKSTRYNDSELPAECTHYTAYLYAEYGAEGGIKFGTTSVSVSERKVIYDEYNSPVRVVKHYEDGIQRIECSRGIDWDSKFGRFYTRGSSAYAGNGWSKGKNSYGLDGAGEPYAIYEYELNDNEEATITKYYGNMRALVIPKELDGYVVKEIANGVFTGNHYITSVDIPDTVELIGASAFENCSALSSVELSTSLKEVGNHAFRDCISLKSIEIPKSLESAGFCPFCGSGLKYIRFEEGITKLSDGLFAKCEALMDITIPDTVLTIGGGSFEGCINLRSVSIPNSVTLIGNNTFGGCVSLEEIIIPDSVKEIESYAFNGCSNLRDVTLSKKLESIGEYVFYGCDALTSIVIPKSIKEVGGWSGSGPFANDTALKDVYFEDGITSIPDSLFFNCVSLEKINIPDTVVTIGARAFSGCTLLSEVTLPDSLTFIGHEAFGNCDALESISIPDSVTKMDGYVFYDCLKLSDVKLSNNLVDIGDRVFGNCDALTSITIPKTLKTVNNGGDLYGPFEDCDNLKEVKFEEGIISIPNCLFVRCYGLEKIEIPDTVERIEYRAFFNATNLKEVTIPDSVTTICNTAFSECDSLEKIVIPDSVTVLENSAFYSCTALEKVVLSENLKTIENSAFQNCESLSDIVLPDGLETIDYRAFTNCDSLTKIVIPDSVTEIGHSLFSDTESLTDVTIGTGISVIPNSCFANSASLTEITLPYTINEIQGDAFKECAKLTNIFIPRATTTIGSNVFSYPAKMTISGVAGTYAETYANEQGIKFENKEVKATEVSVGESALSVNRGESFKLPLVVTPADFTDMVTWRSTDTNVVSVDENGELYAKTAGTATIKVTVGDVSATCKITVEQPVERIYLNASNVSLGAFGSYQLIADVQPDEAVDKSVTWISSDEKVVTVDENGLVKAIGKGTATVTVVSNAVGTVKETCEFTVLNNGYNANELLTFESSHNYENNCSDVWKYTLDYAKNLEVTFSSETNIEEGFDFLYIYDVEGNEVGKYTGTELAGKKIVVPGNTVYIQLVSDEAGTEWGFLVELIEAEQEVISPDNPIIPIEPGCEHEYTNYVYDNNATTEADGTQTAYCDKGCGTVNVMDAVGTRIFLDEVADDVILAPPSWDEETTDMIIDSMDNQENEEVKAVTDEYKATNPDAEITTDAKVVPIEEENAGEETMKDIEDLIQFMETKDLHSVAYFDIQVVIKADGKVLGNINKTEEALTFLFAIPEALKQEGRKFIVLRIHNGEISELEVSEVDGNFAIMTDAFSTYAVVYEAEKTPDILLGDVNVDGKINAQDALLILKHAASITKLNESEQIAADINEDAKINASDALMVLKIAAGIIK